MAAGLQKDSNDLLLPFLDLLERLIPARTRKGPWIAGLSGGPDSVALCSLLARAGSSSAGGTFVPRVVALHINHGLRKAAGDADQAVAAFIARELGLPFEAVRLHPPEASSMGSMEAWARRKRYEAFLEAAEGLGASAVLTGHHQNDQAETVLQRILRGASFRGLRGIRMVRPLKSGSRPLLLRPLLPFSKDRILAYLEARGLHGAFDESNLDLSIQRNRIRLVVLPALVKASPRCDLIETLCAMAETAGAIDAMLEKGSRWALKKALLQPGEERHGRLFLPFKQPVLPEGQGEEKPVALSLEAMEKLPSMLRYPLFRKACALLEGNESIRLSRGAFKEAAALMEHGKAGAAVRLTREVEVSLEPGALVFQKGGASPAPRVRYPAVPLPVPGTALLPDGSRVRARVTENRAEAETCLSGKNPFCEVLDGHSSVQGLQVRPRQAGDRFHPLGAPGKRKLKSFLIDLKVPEAARRSLALVCRGDEILWVVSLRMGHPYRTTPSTKRFLILEAL